MGTWIFPVLTVSLGLTVVLEQWFGWMTGVRNRRDYLLIGLVNLLTNPTVVFIYYINIKYLGWNQTGVMAVLELGAVLAEGLCYRAAAVGIRRPWMFAAAANLFSFAAGAVLRTLL